MGPCDLRSIFRQSDKRHVLWTSSRISRSGFLGRTFAIIAASVSIVLISDHSVQASKQGVYFSRAISFRCHALSSAPVKPPSCLWFREKKQQRTYDHLRSVRTQARRIPTGKRRRHPSFRQGIGHNHRQACRSPRAGRTGLVPMTTLARGTVGGSLTFSIAESAFPSRKASEFVF